MKKGVAGKGMSSQDSYARGLMGLGSCGARFGVRVSGLDSGWFEGSYQGAIVSAEESP